MNVKGIRSSMSFPFFPTLVILKLVSKFLEVRDDVSFSFATLYYLVQCLGTQCVMGLLKLPPWSPAYCGG